ncbi:cell division protein FtsA [Dysgonomonadaceae bacterium PH5-43]|nr:cell division protein FtsA [Dysgonomonadaceae bacterium PH5-43]
MKQGEYVAALDLGTSKMLGVAASKDEDGVLKILASEKVASDKCVRRGFVYNIKDAADKVSSLVEGLKANLKPNLKKIYVGVGGQSLRSEYHSVKIELNGEAVDDDALEYLYEECKQYQEEYPEVLDIVSPEYFLDGRPERNPKGVPCDVIEAKYQLIIGRPSFKTCLKTVIEDCEIEIAGFAITPLATAEAVLSSKEKELGCALVEFGAGVTYLSIYKGGLLKYLVTIPLGGDVITKDLCDMEPLEADAEDLKISEGNAISESEPENKYDIIIAARINEIIANIKEQIKISGYNESTLKGGVIITGGGSLLNGLTKSLTIQTNMSVKLATANKYKIEGGVNNFIDNPANATIFGLLMLANENCAEEIPEEPKVEEPTIPKEQVLGPDIFGDEPIRDKKSNSNKRKSTEPKAPRSNSIGNFLKRQVNVITKDLFGDDDMNEEYKDNKDE